MRYLLVLVIVGSQLFACRTARRGARVGDDVATLEVRLTGMATRDVGRADLSYVLECNELGTLNGILDRPNWASFKSKGLKEGLAGCRILIKDQTTADHIRFDGEDKVLYIATNMPISKKADGTLDATAELSIQHTLIVPGKNLVVTVPASFPDTPDGDISAALTCRPAVVASGIFERSADPSSGTLKFTVFLEEATDLQCQSVRVFVNSELKYLGTLSEGEGSFTATPDQDHVIAEALSLKAVTTGRDDTDPPPGPDGPGPVIINPTPEDCGDGEVFDTTTRQCEKSE